MVAQPYHQNDRIADSRVIFATVGLGHSHSGIPTRQRNP